MPKLTAAEVEEFLAEPGHLLRIATVDADGMPRNVPIWYIVHDGRIVFTPRDRSAFYENVLRDPRVGLTIDEEAIPYRKVSLQGRAEQLHAPGEDDAWRDLYRDIAARYIPRRDADAYVDGTIDQPRALLGVSLDPARSKVVTWRMPVHGEDASGIWHRRYYHRGTLMAERVGRSPSPPTPDPPR
jgi:nitroimidazol reductase NimA-like FMN-containing flavoprotein (pyridoxamine 5'-phosphate oxidase superfamily)